MRGVYEGSLRGGVRTEGSSPHARGLRPRAWVRPWRGGGSSPHARGLRHPGGLVHQPARIIPACAGFTAERSISPPARRDHPRMRGVYTYQGDIMTHPYGSSPHARGLPPSAYGGTRYRGIIPACAGFTTGASPPASPRADHPRMRGVYSGWVLGPPASVGSSPHARGLPVQGLAPLAADGIIPACAGFTALRPWRRSRPADHPRMRGVYPSGCRAASTRTGSSPHARGLPREPGSTGSAFWIIPACAGFTRRGRRRRHRRRIIPACAGFTLGDPWNPNGPGVYHPPVSFTADLVPARRSCGSAAVEPRWTTTPWAA